MGDFNLAFCFFSFSILYFSDLTLAKAVTVRIETAGPAFPFNGVDLANTDAFFFDDFLEDFFFDLVAVEPLPTDILGVGLFSKGGAASSGYVKGRFLAREEPRRLGGPKTATTAPTSSDEPEFARFEPDCLRGIAGQTGAVLIPSLASSEGISVVGMVSAMAEDS